MLHLPTLLDLVIKRKSSATSANKFFAFLCSIWFSVALAQPADFLQFTAELSRQLETDALDVMALGLKHDFSAKLCARVGGVVEQDLKAEVVEWQKRNDVFIKAAASVFNAFGDRYFAAGGEPARQSYMQKVGQLAGKDANDQVMGKLNGASLSNNTVPSERSCAELTNHLRARVFEIEGMRSIIRAMRPYMQAKQTPAVLDLVGSALTTTFQNDKGHFLCLGKTASLKELREWLQPHLGGIDIDKQESYVAVVKAIYTAFPCPFSPLRDELRPATRTEMVGTWLVPDASGKLRHSPQSPAWSQPAGVPPIRCEGVSMLKSGEYRVMQIRGKMDCPDAAKMEYMRNLPQVQSWALPPNGRVRIDRTDVPEAFEEWEIFRVQKEFGFFGIQFSVGDLVAYMRRAPGNEINVAAAFRHMTPMQK